MIVQQGVFSYDYHIICNGVNFVCTLSAALPGVIFVMLL
jgi:hypothetical protein